MDNINISKILERIQKLQALANDNGASESEVNQATAHIQRLLDKHNLSLEQIEPVKQSDIQFTTEKNAKKKLMGWEFNLAHTLASNFYCKVLTIGSDIQFIGTKSDIQITINLFRSVRVLFDAMASKRVTEYTRRMFTEFGITDTRHLQGAQSLKTFRLSYLAGAVNGLAQKLREQRATSDQSITALVVRRDLVAKTAMHEKYPNIRSVAFGNASFNQDASTQGFIDGKNINLHKELP